MNNIINTMLTSNVKNVPSCVDGLAFYDDESNRIIVISTKDYMNHDYSNYTVIKKTSELSDFDCVRLFNLKSFISKNPESHIESYIAARHSSKVLYNFDLYVTAYIVLYRTYKSFETLVENNFITFIDTFIDNCISSKSDHPSTICYYNYDIHKILKLRKTVFTMFKDYLNNYNNYLYIYTNQKEYKYTDKQFRAILKTLKVFSKAQLVVKKRLVETFETFENNEAV